MDETARGTPFTLSMIEGLYKTECVGDTGVLAAKYMEMHAYRQGANAMAGLTDADVGKI